MYFVAIRLQWRRCVRLGARVAILQAEARGFGRFSNGKPFQKQGMGLRQTVGQRNHDQSAVPKILALVVLRQPCSYGSGLADIHPWQASIRHIAQQEIHANLLRFRRLEEVCQLTARHFDHAHDACGDLGDAHAARVTGWEVNLDGLGAGHHLPQESFSPVTRLNTGLAGA